jgi:spore photoproduct lyase
MTDVENMNRKQERTVVKSAKNAGIMTKITKRHSANQVKTIDSTCRNTKTVINKHDQRNISLERYALKVVTRQGTVLRVGDGNIIRRFEKTPTPRKNTDVICPHFCELAWSHGCPADPPCSWCYLQGTFRWESYKTPNHRVPPKLKSREEIEKVMLAFLDAPNLKPHLLNTGELSDSLMQERGPNPFSKFIMSFFKGTRHKVLFLTKMTDVHNFVENKWQKNAILAWSINALAVANRYEGGMPKPLERIKAAKLIYDAGYTVRVRLDPMVPVEDWPEHYGDIIDSICDNFKPERVTLGTLRGLPSTIAAAKDKEWVKYLTESSNWGRKPSLETRMSMYSYAIHAFRKRGIRKIAVCKDTKQVWSELKTMHGLDYHKMACNCLG